MTVVVEDGSIVANANSYVELAEIRAYAAERGITVPTDDVDLEPKLHLAMDWFEGYKFVGVRTDETQALSFPRVGVTIDGVVFGSDEIPALVGKIIMQATCDAVTIELEPSYAGTVGGNVKKKKLDVIEKEFFEPSWSSEQPRLTKLIRMLEPLTAGGLSSGQLKVNRV